MTYAGRDDALGDGEPRSGHDGISAHPWVDENAVVQGWGFLGRRRRLRIRREGEQKAAVCIEMFDRHRHDDDGRLSFRHMESQLNQTGELVSVLRYQALCKRVVGYRSKSVVNPGGYGDDWCQKQALGGYLSLMAGR